MATRRAPHPRAGSAPAPRTRRGGAPSPGRGGVTVAREAHGRERTLIEHDRLPLSISCALDGLARHRAAGEPLDKVVAAIARERHLGPRERRATGDLAFSWARHALAVEALLKRAVKSEGGVAPRRRQLDLAGLCIAALATGHEVDPRATAGLPAFLQALVEDVAAGGLSLPPSLPGWLGERLTRRFGADVASALQRPALPDVAVDRRLVAVDDVVVALTGQGLVAQSSPRCATAVRVVEGTLSLRKLAPTIRAAVWPMDEGSQRVAHALGASPGERVLDLCAGGGGKSRLLASTGAVVVAADIDAGRLRKSVPAGVQAIVADGLHPPFSAGSFDRVLVDAPCSGTGTLRRAPDLALRLDERELPTLVSRQEALLRSALMLVRPGGRVVYATCSLLDEENEGVVRAVCAERADVVRLDEGQYLLPPDSDGFYVAVLERRA
jgi:16S rRNA (cytosine967-C5)-methyltransferase